MFVLNRSWAVSSAPCFAVVPLDYISKDWGKLQDLDFWSKRRSNQVELVPRMDPEDFLWRCCGDNSLARAEFFWSRSIFPEGIFQFLSEHKTVSNLFEHFDFSPSCTFDAKLGALPFLEMCGSAICSFALVVKSNTSWGFPVRPPYHAYFNLPSGAHARHAAIRDVS